MKPKKLFNALLLVLVSGCAIGAMSSNSYAHALGEHTLQDGAEFTALPLAPVRVRATACAR